MNLILAKVENKTEEQLLQEWYMKDTNAKPAEYVLQEITKNLKRTKTSEEEISQARQKWQEAEGQLKDCVRKCVKLCQKDGSIGTEEAEKYFWSGKSQTCFVLWAIGGINKIPYCKHLPSKLI